MKLEKKISLHSFEVEYIDQREAKAPHPAPGKHRAGWWPDEHARPPEPDSAELDPAAVRPAGLHRGSDPQGREPDRQG